MFVMEKEGKTCFIAEKDDFNRQTACKAPGRWLKYTTAIYRIIILFDHCLLLSAVVSFINESRNSIKTPYVTRDDVTSPVMM